jgi:hypothetical protein
MKPETTSSIQIVISLIGMFVGPWLAVKWSLKQFRSEKWWEKQYETYSAILEHLSVIQYNSANYCEGIELRYTYAPGDAVKQKMSLACSELDKYTAQEAYLISDAAAEALRSYQREAWAAPEDSPHDAHEKSYAAAKKCIAVLTAEAKKLLL